MELEILLKILVLVVGFYMAWNIGANDVSNAMGTSVGSGALSLRQAVIVAAFLEFGGAFFLGSNVSETMQTGLIDPQMFVNTPLILILGMCAALCGTSIWLQVASYFGWPVSTTHAIVGAIIGFGALVGGIHTIEWHMVGSIALSWVLSPTLSGILAYLLFYLVQVQILFALNPTEKTKKLLPFFAGAVVGVFTLSLVFKGLSHMHWELSVFGSFSLAILAAVTAGIITLLFTHNVSLPEDYAEPGLRHLPQNVISLQKAMKHLDRVRNASAGTIHDKLAHIVKEMKTISHELQSKAPATPRPSEFHTVEKMFGYLQILSACFVAFAHGANDVANAIGPVAAVLGIIKTGITSGAARIPVWLLAFGGLGIVIGLATWGWRVIETIGKKITELSPTRGFCAEFAAATTILIASKIGLPISTTHCLVGAVLGVGLARGLRALNLRMLKDIVLSWVITMPASAFVTIVVYYIFKIMFRSFFGGLA